MVRNPTAGMKVSWKGCGSLKHKTFKGRIIAPNVLKDKLGRASRVRALKGQGFIVDENILYNWSLKKRR